MKIGIIKETKNPIDNRVALTPEQVAFLNSKYTDSQIVVESSHIRAYSDSQYIEKGVTVTDNLSDCDILFGIKEASIDSIIPNKHYFFFGHIAKMQEYNRPLIQAMINKKISFSDYEYLVDDNNKRVCAFGWWAGVVGTYYTLRAYGLKYKLYNLPKPTLKFTLEQLIDELKSIKLPKVKLIVTGNGRVSQGVQYVLSNIGATEVSEKVFLSNENTIDNLTWHVADIDKLVEHKNKEIKFDFSDFCKNPSNYKSSFFRFAENADILISAHYWDSNAPVYLDTQDLANPRMKIRVIGDVTCDIMGSIKSTIRPSTHDDPFYDYNPNLTKEEELFSNKDNITVMAVDTCPNALALDTSKYFGNMLIEHVFTPLLENKESDILKRANILHNGKLTDRYSYLNDFASQK